jgi:3-hydroxyisobutyrate dehydrogenase-like beta-hydroxyacid dehydrogenase
MEAMGEALTLAEKNGIDRSAFIDMISHTLFASPIYQNYGKMIAERRFTPVGFQMTLGLKDINLFLDSAEQVQAPMPLGNLVHDRLLSSIARGRTEADWAEFTRLISEAAGIE